MSKLHAQPMHMSRNLVCHRPNLHSDLISSTPCLLLVLFLSLSFAQSSTNVPSFFVQALAINSSMFAATQSDRFGRSQNTFNSQGRRGTFHLDQQQQQQQQQLNHNSSQNISSSSSSPASMAAKNGMRGALPAFRDQVSRFDQPLTTRLGATPGPAFYAPSTAAVEQSTKRSFIVNENGKWV